MMIQAAESKPFHWAAAWLQLQGH